MKTVTLTRPGHYTYTLDKAGEHLEITGRFWLKKNDSFDLCLTIIHRASHTTATTSLKAVAQGQSTVNLQGTIVVEKNTIGTNSFLEERVLLLSPKSRATAIPNLEILSDEVKCSHAATIGRPDEIQLFYLTSRGLSRAQALNLLAKGFLATVTQTQP